MARINWLGTIDGDLTKIGNWSATVPTTGDVAVIDAAFTGYVDGPMSGSLACDEIDVVGANIYGGDYTSFSTPIGCDTMSNLQGGTFNSEVYTTGTISGGHFLGFVTVYGTNGFVTGGLFDYTGGSGGVRLDSGGSCSGGTFNYEVRTYGSSCYIMSGSVFQSSLADYGSNNTIQGGTFNGRVDWTGAIGGGTFNAPVYGFSYCYIYGGTFYDIVDLSNYSNPSSGDFYKMVTCHDNCWIQGGNYHAGLTLVGTSCQFAKFDGLEMIGTFVSNGKWVGPLNINSTPCYVTGVQQGVNGSAILGVV